MSSDKLKIKILKRLTVKDLEEIISEIKAIEGSNVTEDSSVKIFFGGPADDKEMRVVAVGIGNSDESDLVIIVEPKIDDTADRIARTLEELKETISKL